ncbi:hypothetical protein BGZ94_008750 [Podila epigama]|nr:hypothetical protein BGZ94_008750 [Podila epigama]
MQEHYSQPLDRSQQQHQHQHQQHQQQHYSGMNPPAPLSLANSQLLTGGLDGLGSMPGPSGAIGGFTPVDSVMESQRLYQQQQQSRGSIVSSTTASSSSVTAANTTISDASSVLKEGKNGHSNQTMTMNNLDGYSALNDKQQQQQQQQSSHMSSNVSTDGLFSGLTYTPHDIMIYQSVMSGGGSFTADGDLLASVAGAAGDGDLDPSVADLLGSDIIVGGGGPESLMEYMNDPDLVLREQMFSKVATSSVFSHQGTAMQQHQQTTSFSGGPVNVSSASSSSQQQQPQGR